MTASDLKPGTVLATATAVASVPIRRVEAHIHTRGARRLLGLGPDQSLAVGAVPEKSMVWMHGGYWYQGEYIFESAGDNRTRVTYRIRNISGRPDWLIRIWQRRHLRTLQLDVDRFAAELPARVAA